MNKPPPLGSFLPEKQGSGQGVAGLLSAGYSHSFAADPFSPAGDQNAMTMMTRQKVLDQYFMDARHKLIDIAAFLDRVERAEGDSDFRMDAFRDAIKHLEDGGNDRAKDVLMAFSDPTPEPIAVAPGKGACGAWPGEGA